MDGNFHEKPEESPRIKFHGFKFRSFVRALPSTLEKA